MSRELFDEQLAKLQRQPGHRLHHQQRQQQQQQQLLGPFGGLEWPQGAQVSGGLEWPRGAQEHHLTSTQQLQQAYVAPPLQQVHVWPPPCSMHVWPPPCSTHV